MTEISAYSIGLDYKEMYGIDTSSLGCVMLNTDSPWGTHPDVEKVREFLKQNEYKSEKFQYVQGLAEEWHTTVRYGLLPEVPKSHVQRIINAEGLAMSKPTNRELILGTTEVWSSTNGEDYECVVVRVKDSFLNYWYELFGMLPNIVTFPQYKPHITIGYFKPGTWEPIFDEQIRLTVKSLDWRFNSVLR